MCDRLLYLTHNTLANKSFNDSESSEDRPRGTDFHEVVNVLHYIHEGSHSQILGTASKLPS